MTKKTLLCKLLACMILALAPITAFNQLKSIYHSLSVRILETKKIPSKTNQNLEAGLQSKTTEVNHSNPVKETEEFEVKLSLPSGDWQLIWNDEFNGRALDLTKWNIVDWVATKNNELQYYSPDNVIVENGHLRLTSEKRTGNGRDYISGAVETSGKLGLRHGKIDIRARLPRGQGIFPALWLLADNIKSLPEIDIMELLGHKPNEIWTVYHWIAKDGQQRKKAGNYIGPDFSQEFHTFGIEWDAEKIIWLIDGYQVFATTEDVPDAFLFLYMNTAVGGDWPGNPDDTTIFPQYFDIDYVRVYKKVN